MSRYGTEHIRGIALDVIGHGFHHPEVFCRLLAMAARTGLTVDKCKHLITAWALE